MEIMELLAFMTDWLNGIVGFALHRGIPAKSLATGLSHISHLTRIWQGSLDFLIRLLYPLLLDYPLTIFL